jgi:CopG family nickel-responsive transcriptional regulator
LSELIRFGVSLDKRLLSRFDEKNKKVGYQSRSEAIRDLIRNDLIHEEWTDCQEETMGVFSLVYDHHYKDLHEKLNSIQHKHVKVIVSSTHIHMDHCNCLEVIILRGKSQEIKLISDELSSAKGVKHGKLIMTTTGGAIA